MGRGSLTTNGSKCLKSAPVNCVVGLAGVETDCCSGRGNGDSRRVRLCDEAGLGLGLGLGSRLGSRLGLNLGLVLGS